VAYSRYSNVNIFLNKNKDYKNTFYDKRDISQAFQYGVSQIKYPSEQVRAQLENIPLVWKSTDTLYNIAHQYYGFPDYWWVVAWYNKKASEAEFKVGDVYFVPLPLEDLIGYF